VYGTPIALCSLHLVNTASHCVTHCYLASPAATSPLSRSTVTKPGLAMSQGREYIHRLLSQTRSHPDGSQCIRKTKWVSQSARQSTSHTKPDTLIIRIWARRVAIFTKDLRYCNLNKIHHGRFLPLSLQFIFRSRPNIRWNARLINLSGKAPLNSQRISH
jgi:hypothetical protein